MLWTAIPALNKQPWNTKSFCRCIVTVFVSLLEGKYQLWGMMLCMNNQILPALHLQQPADGSVLGKPKVVIHNQSIFLLLALQTHMATDDSHLKHPDVYACPLSLMFIQHLEEALYRRAITYFQLWTLPLLFCFLALVG